MNVLSANLCAALRPAGGYVFRRVAVPSNSVSAIRGVESPRASRPRPLAESLEPRRLLSQQYAVTDRLITWQYASTLGVVADAQGNLYGTTGDIIWELPANGASIVPLATVPGTNGTATTGAVASPLVVDNKGDVFASVWNGVPNSFDIEELPAGSNSLVIAASLPVSVRPNSILLTDAADNVYFAARDTGGEAIFEVPLGAGAAIKLASFDSQYSIVPSLGMDSQGNIFGQVYTYTNAGLPTGHQLFELTKGENSIKLLAHLDPPGPVPDGEDSVAIDSSGNLFCTASSYLFELPAGQSTAVELAPSVQNITLDEQGNIFGSAFDDMTVTPAGGHDVITIAQIDWLGLQFGDILTPLVSDHHGHLFTTTSGGIKGSMIVEVAPRTSSQLVIQQQPVDGNNQLPVGSAIVVNIEDAAGHTIWNDDSNITLSIASGPAGAMVSGTTTVAAAAGSARFTGLSFPAAGTYTLAATNAAAATAVTNSFTILGSRIVFQQPPVNTTVGHPFAQPVAVRIEDSNGDVITGDTASVTLSITSGPAGGMPGGPVTTAATAGVAAFYGLTLSAVGTYSITATASNLSVTSDPFNVTAPSSVILSLQASPNPAPAGYAVTLTATLDPQSYYGFPTGTVSFYDGGTLLGSEEPVPVKTTNSSVSSFAMIAGSGSSVTIIGGGGYGDPYQATASLTVSDLSADVHQLTARYSGDNNYEPITSAAVLQTIAPVSLVPTITGSTVPVSVVATTPNIGVVTVSLANQTTTAQAFEQLSVYATVPGAALDGSQIRIGQVARLMMVPAQSAISVQVAVSAAQLATAGDYSVVAIVTGPKDQLGVSAPGPQLHVEAANLVLSPTLQSITLPPAVIGGLAVRAIAKVQVTNNGNIPSDGFISVGIGASQDGGLTSQGGFGFVNRYLRIDPGANVTVIVPLQQAPNVPAGDYQIIATVQDPHSQDKSAASPTIVHIAAPYTAISASFDRLTLGPSLVAGRPTPALAVLKLVNSGNEVSFGEFSTRLAVSSDGTIDDGVFTTVVRPLMLAPNGGSARIVLPLRAIPNVPDGSYHVLAVITDPSSAVTSTASVATSNIGAPNVALSESFLRLVSPPIVYSGRATSAVAVLKISNGGNDLCLGQVSIKLSSIDSPEGGYHEELNTVVRQLSIPAAGAVVVAVPLRRTPTGAYDTDVSLAADVTDPLSHASSATSVQTFHVLMSGPRLSATVGAFVPSRILPGQSGTLTVTIRNYGNERSIGPANLGLYIDPIPNDGGFPVAGTNYDNLVIPPGGRVVERISMTNDANVASVMQYFPDGAAYPYVIFSQDGTVGQGGGQTTVMLK